MTEPTRWGSSESHLSPLDHAVVSRKGFLKGVLVAGVAASGLPASALAATTVSRGLVPLPGSAPDPALLTQIDTWIAVHADNTATVYTGRIDMGQGTGTAWRQIVAEELDLSFEQVRFVQPDTIHSPDSGGTTGSSSIQTAGRQVRNAAANARQALLSLASTFLEAPASSLTVAGGVVSGGSGQVTYAQLLGDRLFNVTMTTIALNPGAGISKPVGSYKLVGTPVPRFDIPDKVTGKFTYLHNIRVPGMLHGRVVRPRGQGEYGQGARVVSIDEGSVSHLADVQVLRQGDFVGIVAPREYDAIQAASELNVQWASVPTLPGNGNMYGSMRSLPTADVVKAQRGDVDSGFARAATVLASTYRGPYQMHGPIGPSCAIAAITVAGGTVLSDTNYPYRLRSKVVSTIPITDPTSVRIQYQEGASNFGHSLSDDAAEAAALMSYLVNGTPVRVQFMRWDEHGWDNYGPAQLLDIRGGVDSGGKIIAWDIQQWSSGGQTSTETTQELSAQSAPGPTDSQVGGNLAAGQIYDIANYRFLDHSATGVLTRSLRGGTLRSPFDPSQLFGAEQMVDQLAHAAGMDPVAFRFANLGADARWAGVLNAVANLAKWQPKVAASDLSRGNVVVGRGIALGTHKASYAAVVVDIAVNKKSGKITPIRNFAAIDAGLIVNPGLIENQVVGQQIMGTSRALYEETRFSRTNVTSLDWVTYPILRFKDHPHVATVLVNRSDQLPTGAGEETLAPVAAAIANAFFDATGVRVQQYPMTASLIRATLAATTG